MLTDPGSRTNGKKYGKSNVYKYALIRPAEYNFDRFEYVLIVNGPYQQTDSTETTNVNENNENNEVHENNDLNKKYYVDIKWLSTCDKDFTNLVNGKSSELTWMVESEKTDKVLLSSLMGGIIMNKKYRLHSRIIHRMNKTEERFSRMLVEYDYYMENIVSKNNNIKFYDWLRSNDREVQIFIPSTLTTNQNSEQYPPHKCGVCKTYFSTTNRLNNHMRKYVRDWIYCDIPPCKSRYKYQRNLNRHKIKKHNNEKELVVDDDKSTDDIILATWVNDDKSTDDNHTKKRKRHDYTLNDQPPSKKIKTITNNVHNVNSTNDNTLINRPTVAINDNEPTPIINIRYIHALMTAGATFNVYTGEMKFDKK